MPGEGITQPQRTEDDSPVLVLPSTSADGAAIKKLLDTCSIPSRLLTSVAALCEGMRGNVGAVVIAEEALLADAPRLIERLRAQEVWSDLPVIVLSRSGREPVILADILPHGNFSIVERPVRASTLASLIRSSLRARRRQLEVREHMAQRENAQRVIREAERRYRLLVENITDYAIFMIDKQGRVASWNSGAQHLLGYSAAEIVGLPAALLFEDQGATLERNMNEARSSGRATSSGWRRRRAGSRLFGEGVLTAVRDDADQLLGYSKLIRDITDRRRIELEREQLLQSERAARSEAERSGRMKDEFLATLSHELRTPLNAILGWSQVLGRLGATGGDLRDGLKVIERNARAQAQIIDDLLDMSSIVSGKVRLAMQHVDLASIVEASLNAVRPAAEAKGVALGAALERQASTVAGDPNRLQQVFWNLLTNAVKFTPQNGRVSVKLERRGSQLEVVVSDSGEGIDASFLPHIFERFRQADASASRRHGGLGLGLSIVKQLVELHGGAVLAASAGSGRGSTFTVTLPAAAVRAQSVERHGAAEQPVRAEEPEVHVRARSANLCGVKVLVVDDEADARSLIERLLKECAATVTTAGSAGEALEQVTRERPDVLLSDIGMPKEDGYALIRRIRELDGEEGRIPAIALTAYARAEDRARALQAGYQLHLAKPVDASELVAMVASLAGRAEPRANSPARRL